MPFAVFDVNPDRFGIRFGKTENQVGETAVFPVGFIQANPAIEQHGEIQELKGFKTGRLGGDVVREGIHDRFS
jgi:hypothetical protein